MTKTNRRFKKFWTSKSGGVLIYVAFGLPMLVGAMALSIDLGRAFILNTELKDFSDAAALAGAAELDGRDGARAAAEQAARTGLDGTLINVQAFATDSGGATMTIDQVVFLRNLPEDGTDFTVDDTATSDADARFIFVSVVNRDVRSGLSRALGVIPDFQTSAKSIAGFSSLVCRIPAMMMCNPLEDATFAETILNCGPGSGGTGAGWAEHEDCVTGAQVLMKTAGNGAAYNPGEFGLLDPPWGNQGANAVADLIASAAPNFCISTEADLRTGQAMGPVVSAVNTRFDIYSNPQFGGNTKSNPEFRPAMNVTKGYTDAPGTCSETPPAEPPTAYPADAHPYPRDNCFKDGNCHQDRFGNGDWQRDVDHDGDGGAATAETEPYWAIQHPGTAQPSGYAQMTRYELYRYEIENNPGAQGIPNNSNPGPGENGNPTCYTGGTLSDPSLDADDTGLDEIDRRILVMAVINCVENGPLNGNEDDVPVEGFVKMFLTEPAQGQGNDKADIFGEIAGVLKPGESDAAKDIVQLYR